VVLSPTNWALSNTTHIFLRERKEKRNNSWIWIWIPIHFTADSNRRFSALKFRHKIHSQLYEYILLTGRWKTANDSTFAKQGDNLSPCFAKVELESWQCVNPKVMVARRCAVSTGAPTPIRAFTRIYMYTKEHSPLGFWFAMSAAIIVVNRFSGTNLLISAFWLRLPISNHKAVPKHLTMRNTTSLRRTTANPNIFMNVSAAEQGRTTKYMQYLRNRRLSSKYFHCTTRTHQEMR